MSDTALHAPFTAALIQMRSTRKVDVNVAEASRMIREAAAAGAVYVQTPEMTNIMEAKREALFAAIEPEDTDPSLAAFRELARDLKIHLHIGSIAVKASPERAANRAFLIDPSGTVTASYDKIHMFDVDLGNGETYRESASYQPGENASIADLPFGRVGLTICYDLRFPALFRALAESGASFLAVPSAFTRPTGEAHWHTLLRARAIENTCYVLAAAQGGKHENGRETYGHSLIVDPWGEIVAEGGVDPGIITAVIDPAKVADARKRVPSLQHGRRFVLADHNRPDHLRLVKGPV